MPQELRNRFPLVIAGAKGWHSSGLVSLLQSQNDRQVRFLGQIGSQALSHLYAGAALFAFPSIYEGFGLPPLEAMENRGFTRVEILRLHPNTAITRPEDTEDSSLKAIADRLYGPQDYSLIGYAS